MLRTAFFASIVNFRNWLKGEVRAPRAVRPLSGSKRTLRVQNRAAPSRLATAAGDRDGQMTRVRVLRAVDECCRGGGPRTGACTDQDSRFNLRAWMTAFDGFPGRRSRSAEQADRRMTKNDGLCGVVSGLRPGGFGVKRKRSAQRRSTRLTRSTFLALEQFQCSIPK